MIQGDRACSEENESEGERGQRQGEFIAAIAHQAIMEVHLGDGYGHIDADGEGGNASEQSHQGQDPAKEFSE
jgi:hypothetical protein